jgi:microtubule-associated protein-like 6
LQGRDSKNWISDVKFSPDGDTLGIASTDHSTYLYNVEDFSSKGRCKKHNFPVSAIDFSDDSRWMQSTCTGGELLFFNTETGEYNARITGMKDVEWSTWTCPYGWPVQGTWPHLWDGTNITSTCSSAIRDVVACADDFGILKVFRYPCTVRGAACTEHWGHSSSGISRVRFTAGDGYILSAGKQDRTIFQWRVEKDDKEEVEETDVQFENEDADLVLDGVAHDRPPQQESANDFNAIHPTPAVDDAEETADGLTAIKPWIGAVVAPTSGVTIETDEVKAVKIPESSLELEWIHGYRSADCSNNLRYLRDGGMVFQAAAIAVTMAKSSNRQHFMTEHSDDIIALAVHPDGLLVATGEMGSRPKIIVWNADTMEIVKVLEGFHQRGVCHLAFSPCGNLLASVGLDEHHSLAVYDWRIGNIQAKTRVDNHKILGLAFGSVGGQHRLVTTGLKHIGFWTLQGRNITFKRALMEKKGVLQPFMCTTFLGEDAVVGAYDGNLYQFEGRNLSRAVKGHEKAISALWSCTAGICTGSRDGHVKLWAADLECTGDFDLAAICGANTYVKSVHWDPLKAVILVGTHSSEIYEISDKDGSDMNEGAVLSGHSGMGEVWGLAVHPMLDEYCTVGDDKTVRIWSIHSRKLLRMAKFDITARAVAYSPDGSHLAVGLGGKKGPGKQKRDGAWMIIRSSDLEIEHEARDSKMWITDIKYTPDGSTLGVASRDNQIYLYDVHNDFTKRAIFTKHNAFITHFDFSLDRYDTHLCECANTNHLDYYSPPSAYKTSMCLYFSSTSLLPSCSQYLQSNCGGFELLFADVTTGSQVASASALKNVMWNTFTCTLGWPVQGVWPEVDDGLDFTSVDRSKKQDRFVTTDEFGKLRLYNYPCLRKDAGFVLYGGHSSHLMKACFSQNDSHVITVGGTDRCVFQWKHKSEEINEDGRSAGNDGADSDVETEGESPSVMSMVKTKPDKGKAGDANIKTSPIPTVQPWLGSIVAPSSPPTEITTPLKMEPILEYVHGYASQTVRNNLRYSSSGKIVYHVACVGIIFDSNTHTQQWYRGHGTNAISCLDTTLDGRFAATGEDAQKPQIHLWDACSGVAIIQLPTVHLDGVSLLNFSEDGKQMVSIGKDFHHSIAVFRSISGQWDDGCCQALCKNYPEKPFFAKFISSASEDYKLLTGGKDHVAYWTVDGKCMRPYSGIFGEKGRIQPVLCAAVAGQNIVTGTVTGDLYLWHPTERKISKSIRAHAKSVNSLYATTSGLVSASKDGTIKIWSVSLAFIQEFDMKDATPPSFNPCLRSIAWDITEVELF